MHSSTTRPASYCLIHVILAHVSYSFLKPNDVDDTSHVRDKRRKIYTFFVQGIAALEDGLK